MLYRYGLYTADGDEDGEAHYAVPITPGETIWTGDRQKLRALDVVPGGLVELTALARVL